MLHKDRPHSRKHLQPDYQGTSHRTQQLLKKNSRRHLDSTLLIPWHNANEPDLYDQHQPPLGQQGLLVHEEADLGRRKVLSLNCLEPNYYLSG